MPAKKAAPAPPKGKTSTAKKGKSSAYNDFLKVQLAAAKEKDPEATHAQRLKAVTKAWATSPENPKNMK